MEIKYGMRNLRPDSPRDECEVAYILGRLEEKESQLGGVEEAVLTFEHHHSGGPQFNVRSKTEAEWMKREGITGPKIWCYWTKENIFNIAAKQFPNYSNFALV